MKIVLLGPPGAGKGTQAVKLANRLYIPRVSSGDLFRDHRKRNTDLGRLVSSYMDSGVLVPDEVTIKMVTQWISDNGGSGFLLDGFPRTLPQAQELGRATLAGGVDIVLYIKVAEEELISRLSTRFLCSDCQLSYNLRSMPPKLEGRCDQCDGGLYQREDDRPEAVKKRISVYFDETEPLIEYYDRMRLLREVDGENSIDEVHKATIRAVGV